MSKPVYFQFPLYALAYGKTELERMEAIVSYCRMATGIEERRRSPAAAAEVIVPADRNVSEAEFCAWTLGAGRLRISGGDAETCARRHRDLQHFCRFYLNPFVHIRNDWFWNCLDRLRGNPSDKPLSYREFVVLCALLSKIGTKKSCSCSWREIQRRALGYKTEQEMQSNGGFRKDKAAPQTRQQIRSTLDRLETNRFFARVVEHAGKAAVLGHFSFSMDRGKLAVAVAEKAGRRRRRLIPALRSRDRAICQAFEIAAKKKPNGADFPAPAFTIFSPPPNGHAATTSPTTSRITA